MRTTLLILLLTITTLTAETFTMSSRDVINTGTFQFTSTLTGGRIMFEMPEGMDIMQGEFAICGHPFRPKSDMTPAEGVHLQILIFRLSNQTGRHYYSQKSIKEYIETHSLQRHFKDWEEVKKSE